MKREMAKVSLRLVARKYGIPEETVKEQIELAIREAFLAARRENDPEVLRLWEEIPREAEIPTACEMVAYLAQKTGVDPSGWPGLS